MANLHYKILISDLYRNNDNTVDLDCLLCMDQVDEQGEIMVEMSIDLDSVSLTDALSGIFSPEPEMEYGEEELSDCHKTLSIMHEQIKDLMKRVEERMEIDGKEVNS
jgi:hypothetical protein